jgi:hypothetical protein
MNSREVNIWNKLILARFKVLSQRLPGETKENHMNVTYDS